MQLRLPLHVYLAVFVEVDSRERSGGYWLGGGLPFELTPQVRRIIETNLADQQVEFLMIELDQPIDKDVLLGGGMGLRHWEVAPKRNQPVELTERIRRFIGTVDAAPSNDA